MKGETYAAPIGAFLCPEIRAFTGFRVRFLRQSSVTIKYYLHPKKAVNSRQWPLMGDTLVQKKAPIGAM